MIGFSFGLSAADGLLGPVRAQGSGQRQPTETAQRQTTGRRILVFDVIETLLDLAPLKAPFAEAFGNPEALKTWFTTLLQYSNIATMTGDYHPFGDLGLAAADTTARLYGVTLSPEARSALVGRVRALPPHPEVPAALARLKQEGFRMVTLTNSAPSAVEAQLDHAGLRPLFERAFTVDAVRAFKPDRRTYSPVAKELGVSPADLRLVGAHGWDIAGALAAGCVGAFIARPGQELYPLAPPPDVIGPDLNAVASRIIEVERPA